ncbi:MAG: desulfoferrodoxin [Planctomycetota bacterium]|nr:desulfoferrodoxin [Planctomycetota bacterium]
MIKQLQVYKCELCGNIVEMLEAGTGELICCGQPMTLQQEQTADVTAEKHVPYIEKAEGGYKVRVGQNTAHPMEEKHYIQWIELSSGEKCCKQFLKPGQEPQAVFCDIGENATAREYCNVHGLWKG